MHFGAERLRSHARILAEIARTTRQRLLHALLRTVAAQRQQANLAESCKLQSKALTSHEGRASQRSCRCSGSTGQADTAAALTNLQHSEPELQSCPHKLCAHLVSGKSNQACTVSVRSSSACRNTTPLDMPSVCTHAIVIIHGSKGRRARLLHHALKRAIRASAAVLRGRLPGLIDVATDNRSGRRRQILLRARRAGLARHADCHVAHRAVAAQSEQHMRSRHRAE